MDRPPSARRRAVATTTDRRARPHRSRTVTMSNVRCPECGFEYDLDQSAATAREIVAAVDELASLMASRDDLAARRSADVWSPLEYACHLRDVFLIQRERVLQARREEEPEPPPMGRDDRIE